MTAWLGDDGRAIHERLHSLIVTPMEAITDEAVEALGLAVFAWQRAHNPVVERLAARSLGGKEPATLAEVPAVPTDVFKVARVACFPEAETVRVFETSGTTQDVRGRHPFALLGLYEMASIASGRRWLLPAAEYRFVLLAESERAAPTSSLSFMLARFAETWDARCWSTSLQEAWMVRDSVLDVAAVTAALDRSLKDGLPVALLGTSFGFVHLLDAIGDRALTLPPGSVAMPTGGFKGRSREIEPDALRAMIRRTFALAEADVIGEYGMTELSSQGYEARREGRASYRVPPWMRVTVVDPETLREVPRGEVGLVRVVDLMNLGSAIAIQTSDLGRVDADGGGFVVLGRAPGATPRGCARAMDAVLSKR